MMRAPSGPPTKIQREAFNTGSGVKRPSQTVAYAKSAAPAAMSEGTNQ
jgi:hypothetical protein